MSGRPIGFAAVAIVFAANQLASLPLPALAQANNDIPNEHDCVIKPKVVIKLGSHDSGIIGEFAVDRGASVKKGQTVVRLRSKLATMVVENARLRAERNVEI